MQLNGQISYHPYVAEDLHAKAARYIKDRGLGNRTDLGRELGSADAQFLGWIGFACHNNVDGIVSKASKIAISNDIIHKFVSVAETKMSACRFERAALLLHHIDMSRLADERCDHESR